MARKPAIPASPAPTAAFACDAAPVDSGRGAPVAVREPDKVAEWTAKMEVLFELVGSPVPVALADATAEDELTTGVDVASAAAGYIRGRMLLMSAGMELYQSGVLPAASDELISAA